MPSTRRIVWRADDQILLVAARYMVEAGYTSVSAFIDDIYAANPAITDPQAIPVGTFVTIPYQTP